MLRLVVLALLAIGIFSQIPGLASHWLITNGYWDEKTRQTDDAQQPTRPDGQRSPTRSGQAVLRANAGGHYYAKAYINNKPIRIVIDTGATLVALTYEDARRLGLKPRPSDFTVRVDTANGVVNYARVTLRRVRIGGAEETNIKAVIAPKGALAITLLGMSYLKKLKNFQVQNGRLLLES